MSVLFRNYHQLILNRIVSSVQTLLLMCQAWNNASSYEEELATLKFPSSYLQLCEISGKVLHDTAEAFTFHFLLSELWTESSNWAGPR